MDGKYNKNMLKDAAKIVDAFWDQEGGTWLLAVQYEIIRELLNSDCVIAAELVIRKMYEMAEVEYSVSMKNRSRLELELFVTMLEDCLEKNSKK